MRERWEKMKMGVHLDSSGPMSALPGNSAEPEGQTMSPARKKTKPASIFQLKIILAETEPAIWRRVLVPSNITLARLHDVLQATMGWTNSHLHQFKIQDRMFSDPR